MQLFILAVGKGRASPENTLTQELVIALAARRQPY